MSSQIVQPAILAGGHKLLSAGRDKAAAAVPRVAARKDRMSYVWGLIFALAVSTTGVASLLLLVIISIADRG